MDARRAKEITESPVMCHVTHNGEPVYIQNVSESEKTARIYPLGNPEQEQNVPVDSLVEHEGKPAQRPPVNTGF